MTDRIELVRTGARRLLRDREACLRRALPSAAREMVQAGLFDRRAVSVSSRKGAVRDGQIYELDGRIQSLDASTTLVPSVDLAAVLLVR